MTETLHFLFAKLIEESVYMIHISNANLFRQLEHFTISHPRQLFYPPTLFCIATERPIRLLIATQKCNFDGGITRSFFLFFGTLNLKTLWRTVTVLELTADAWKVNFILSGNGNGSLSYVFHERLRLFCNVISLLWS